MKYIILSGLIFLISATAQVSKASTSNESFFSRKQNFDNDGSELYSTNYELKKFKKIGVGVTAGGVTGTFGLTSELNLDPELALVLGLGTGPSYGSFNVQGKFNFAGRYISAFLKGGYSKWYSAGRIPSSAGSSDVLKQIYSSQDLRDGKFNPQFAVSSIGVEYNQLRGELSGLNFYGEFSMMYEIQKFKVIPTGAVGLVYFY